MAINKSPESQAIISRARVFSLMDLVTVRPSNAMTISDGIAVSGTKIPKINNCACTLDSPAPAGYASHQCPQGTYGPCLTLCKILLNFGVRVVNEIVKPRRPTRHQARFQ